jgi:AraC family transcriptional regulator
MRRLLQYTFSLLNVDHVNLTSKWNYTNVISPYYRIYYIDSGCGELTAQDVTLKLEPGYLYIIPSFTLCNMSCNYQLSQYFIQFFEESANGISLFTNNRTLLKVAATEIDIILFRRLLEINPGRGINRSDNPRIYEKEIYYKEYQELNIQQNTATYIETQGMLYQLVSRFLNPQIYKFQGENVIPLKVVDTISYILVNLHHKLSVAHLAFRVSQNIDYFSRQFKLYTGTSPVNYINEKRIERAQYLLGTSRMSYSEISEQTGFDNLSYFSKTFKKFTGMSPSSYKKQIYKVGFNHVN